MNRKHELARLLSGYCRENGLKMTDLTSDLKDLVIDLELNPGTSTKITEPRPPREFSDFHIEMVQRIIDFISGSKEIQEKISKARSEIKAEITDERFLPDLRVYFGVDCLEPSIESGTWTPYSDSSLGIYLGDVAVIFSA